MDRSIPGGDLIGRWSSSFADIDFVNSKPASTRLGLAAQSKFFASSGFFAIDPGSIPTDGLSYSAEQLGVEAGEIAGYVNTRMLQTVSVEPKWAGRMTPEDYRGLTPLIYSHVNPYGRFDLDSNDRIDFGRLAA
ncbi:hypothetical protein OY671_007209 [Metschnikowia pulcherrima]|nr:hypothetical protein OY671_007209 [Metschnikowia pulcherrima]